MRTERESAIRLLQLLMVASLLFPAALFAYASYNDYRDVYAVADERINRSLDVQQEQALKVFQTVDRIFPEVDEVVRGMSDADIRAAQSALTPRLQRIVGVMPQVQSILLIGRDGRVLASSEVTQAQLAADYSRSRRFQGASRARCRRPRCRHICQRSAPVSVAGRRHRHFRCIAPPGVGRRGISRHHRGRGAAALLRRLLRHDRPVTR